MDNQLQTNQESNSPDSILPEPTETTTQSEELPESEPSLSKIFEDIKEFLANLSSMEDKSTKIDLPSGVQTLTAKTETMIASCDFSNLGQNKENDSSIFESLALISKLQESVKQFNLADEAASWLNRCSKVLQQAMVLLEEEFRVLLEDSKDKKSKKATSSKESKTLQPDRCILPEQENVKDSFPWYTTEVVSTLNRIAEAMVSAGYESECCHVYSIARRQALEEEMVKLGFHRMNIDDVQKMQWQWAEGETVTWTKVVKHCSDVLFPQEKDLCISIFHSFPEISAHLFSDLSSSTMVTLINFVEAIAMTKRSPEKLFRFLDVHQSLSELIKNEVDSDIANMIKSAGTRLGNAVLGIFSDLENSIKTDNGRNPIPNGTVHPLTSYTMNYLAFACEYKDTLEEIFQQKIPDEKEEDDSEKPSPFSSELASLMELLDVNLESKSKVYKDPSLRDVFLMNNGRYILQKTKGCTVIHHAVGDAWYRRKSFDLRQHHKNYQRETWGKVLALLRDEGLTPIGKFNKTLLKERFKMFNSVFEEIHRTQSNWVIKDDQLQSELRVSISAVIVPAYRSFLGRHEQQLDPGRQAEKYIKFQPDDIENAINELFDGNPTSMGRRRG